MRLGVGALLLATAVIALGACGGDDGDGGGDGSLAELRSHLPAAGDFEQESLAYGAG